MITSAKVLLNMTLAEHYYYDGASVKGSKQAVLHRNQSGATRS